MRIQLQQVEYIPKELEPGKLYVAKQYGAAAHLCACGCGSKIRTPLGPTEWELTEDQQGVSLWPSVGNWQRPCKSHYVIENGQIIWHDQWTARQIEEGRKAEQSKREQYYSNQRVGILRRLWRLFWKYVSR